MNEHFCYGCEHSWENLKEEESHCPDCGHADVHSEESFVIEDEACAV